MAHTFTITIGGELSSREVDKISKALHKATSKWFKQGHDIAVDY